MESAARGIRLERLSKVFWHQTKGEVWAVREVSLAASSAASLLSTSGFASATLPSSLGSLSRSYSSKVSAAS